MSGTAVVRFGDVTLRPIPHPEHDWTLTSVEIAEALECDPSAIRHAVARHGGELIEGRHWYSVTERHAGKQPRTVWTKRGLIRLSFFVRSAKAIAFRDWAEDLVLFVMDGRANPLDALLARLADAERRLAALEARPAQGRLFALPAPARRQARPVAPKPNVGAIVARKAAQRAQAIAAITEAGGINSINQLAATLCVSWATARSIALNLIKDGTVVAGAGYPNSCAVTLRVAS